MERRKPLKRTPMKRGKSSGLKRSAMKRGQSELKRSAIKQKPHEPDDEWVTNRLLAIRRDRGRCPRERFPADAGECGSGIVVHHIQPAGRGRKRNHALANLITLCPHHHDWVHSHPAQAKELELLRSSHDEPLTDP